jgi:hypothetical protein
LHRFSQIFINKNKSALGALDDSTIQKQATDIVEWLCQNEFQILQTTDNKFTKSLLVQEATRFANFINLEQSHSAFKPTKLEQYFGKKAGTEIKISVQNQNYDIVGIVDRIDEYEDNFTANLLRFRRVKGNPCVEVLGEDWRGSTLSCKFTDFNQFVKGFLSGWYGKKSDPVAGEKHLQNIYNILIRNQ